MYFTRRDFVEKTWKTSQRISLPGLEPSSFCDELQSNHPPVFNEAFQELNLSDSKQLI